MGWMLNNNKGQIATDESYGGYLNQDGFCHFDLTLPKEDMTRKIVTGATITGCTQVVGLDKQNTTSAAEATARLNDALAHIGPVAVSVDAGPNGFNGTAASTPQDFYYYAGGITTTRCAAIEPPTWTTQFSQWPITPS